MSCRFGAFILRVQRALSRGEVGAAAQALIKRAIRFQQDGAPIESETLEVAAPAVAKNRGVRVALKFDVLRLRDFRLVYEAALVSPLGDGVVPVALAFAVRDLTGSATDLGIVLAARTLAWRSSARL